MASMGMSWLSVLCGLGLAFMLLIAAQDLRDGSGAGAYWVVQSLLSSAFPPFSSDSSVTLPETLCPSGGSNHDVFLLLGY